MKILWKLTLPQLFLLLFLSFFSYLLIRALFTDTLNSYVTATVNERVARIYGNIARSADQAVKTSSLFADMPEVRDAYDVALSGNIDDPYSPQTQTAREMLRATFAPLLARYSELTGETLMLHFHLPNARSLVRLWQQRQTRVNGEWTDISDDLSPFRPTILDVNRRMAPTQGIEIGRDGFAVRGVVPLLDAGRRHIGSVETLQDFDAVLAATADEAHTTEMLYVKDEFLPIATALQDPLKHPRVDGFVLAATRRPTAPSNSSEALPDDIAELIAPSLLKAAIHDRTVENHGSLYLVATPVVDFRGTVAGVLVCSMRTDQLTRPALETLAILLAMFAGILLTHFLLNLFTLRFLVTRPISGITSQIEAIVNENITQAKPIAYSWHDEIGDLVGRFNSLLTKFTNIFDKMRQIQTDLRAARNLAEEHAGAKSLFLANMSHEIRTPMNAVIGMTNIARASDDPQRKEYCLAKIADASHHLLGIINDILDISKIEAGKLELSSVDFNFSKMINRVLTVTAFRVEEKKQHLSVTVDDAIPDVLIADEQRLAQVIANLLSNAVKFTDEGGNIALAAEKILVDGGQCLLRITVKDTGIGITAEQQAGLFHNFQQAGADISRKYGGTGLGLAISKQIIEMMSGRIWVESQVGRGSSFFVELALSLGNVGNLHADDDDDDAHCDIGEKDIFAGKRLLLAEDVDINQEIIQALLEHTGVAVECVGNGLEAFEKFSASPGRYDLILMDIEMPVMDGYEATRKIRASALAEAAKIPIIAMTANVFREDMERCLAAGMNGHLGKPVDSAVLIRLLRTYLGNSSSQESSSSTL